VFALDVSNLLTRAALVYGLVGEEEEEEEEVSPPGTLWHHIDGDSLSRLRAIGAFAYTAAQGALRPAPSLPSPHWLQLVLCCVVLCCVVLSN
jgi:hypothetical protein